MVPALAVLFPDVGSDAPEATLAWLVMLPAVDGRILIATVASAPFATVPSGQVTVPETCEQLPWDGNALT